MREQLKTLTSKIDDFTTQLNDKNAETKAFINHLGTLLSEVVAKEMLKVKKGLMSELSKFSLRKGSMEPMTVDEKHQGAQRERVDEDKVIEKDAFTDPDESKAGEEKSSKASTDAEAVYDDGDGHAESGDGDGDGNGDGHGESKKMSN
ncbi:hypothetical protein TorRG33x02_120550 [Trema orientale]|uniref:Uncharacterized protein n=1 Tax=Trema orientale TaxID=63057 RepID=A0A2P5F358_TREOI|nr:hypothetical protein TorRG33x02_120550 [Trema orientale]